ncbi:MAG TPA: S8 family peptidase [Luteibaculaceae bacterium]|nr:S8 family peptidase [Luteibaculaceae bacterium]
MKKLLTIGLSFASVCLQAQYRSIVFFADKPVQEHFALSPESSERRARAGVFYNETDWPVNPLYIKQLAEPGVKVVGVSRWLNAAMVQHNHALPLSKWKGVKQVVMLKKRQQARSTMGSSLVPAPAGLASDKNQVLHHAELLDSLQLKGEGIYIAIFDAGFQGVDTTAAFRHLFSEQRLRFTRDVVNGANVFQYDEHGTQVYSIIGAQLPGRYEGLAPMAQVALFVTENVFSETQTEEFNWVVAAETADSLGVQLINSSLGYTEFDDPSTDYTTDKMDGKTAISTQGARMAAQKGILVVNSAGNYRQQSWGKMGAPSDADSILSVGALLLDSAVASFSSPGPTADGRIKPDVSSLGVRTAAVNRRGELVESNGTSFAAPLVAGLCTALWSQNPLLSAQEVRRRLMTSSHLSQNPNNDMGYGIPDMRKALNLFSEPIPFQTARLYPNPGSQMLFLQVGEFSGSVSVELLSSNGGLIDKQELTVASQQEIDLSVFCQRIPQSGTYFIRITEGDKQRTFSWVAK